MSSAPIRLVKQGEKISSRTSLPGVGIGRPMVIPTKRLASGTRVHHRHVGWHTPAETATILSRYERGCRVAPGTDSIIRTRGPHHTNHPTLVADSPVVAQVSTPRNTWQWVRPIPVNIGSSREQALLPPTPPSPPPPNPGESMLSTGGALGAACQHGPHPPPHTLDVPCTSTLQQPDRTCTCDPPRSTDGSRHTQDPTLGTTTVEIPPPLP